MDARENDDTGPAKNRPWFTTTHWSLVLTAGKEGAPEADAALERLCKTYWYPLYAYVRQRGNSPHDAQDLTQGFFAALVGKNYLGQVAREKGKFRSFLLASLNHFLANEHERANALKRGGGRAPVSLDAEMAEGHFALEPVSELTPERAYEQRWAAALLEQALANLQNEYVQAGKEKMFKELKPFLTESSGSGEYAPVAARLGMAPGTLSVAVHRLRQRYREVVRAEVANTVASPGETDEEMRHLLAILNG